MLHCLYIIVLPTHQPTTLGMILNPASACRGKESTSTDGIHYGDEVYQVMVQMISNAYMMRFPVFYQPTKGKSAGGKTGSGKYSLIYFVDNVIILYADVIIILIDKHICISYESR